MCLLKKKCGSTSARGHLHSSPISIRGPWQWPPHLQEASAARQPLYCTSSWCVCVCEWYRSNFAHLLQFSAWKGRRLLVFCLPFWIWLVKTSNELILASLMINYHCKLVWQMREQAWCWGLHGLSIVFFLFTGEAYSHTGGNSEMMLSSLSFAVVLAAPSMLPMRPRFAGAARLAVVVA